MGRVKFWNGFAAGAAAGAGPVTEAEVDLAGAVGRAQQGDAEAFRLLDWIMSHFHDDVTRRVVFEKGSQAQTGSPMRRPPATLAALRQSPSSTR